MGHRRSVRVLAVTHGAIVLFGVLVAAPAEADAVPAVGPRADDHRCAAPPQVTVTGFRHRRSRVLARLDHNHRGIDVLAAVTDPRQEIAGKLAHGPSDKDLEDEDVEVFACDDGAWRSLGGARTDDDGRFSFFLEGAARLGPGMRDLYLASKGDGRGAYFVGYVDTPDKAIVVTDVDGTITSSENGIIRTATVGTDLAHRRDAPQSFSRLPQTVVYLTARGDAFTEVTRQWLTRHGFPRGVLRLYRGSFARPGDHAMAFKTKTLRGLPLRIAAGVGNRRSDVIAYRNAGVPGNQILIYLPEYEKEVRASFAAGKAVGFRDYRSLPGLVAERARQDAAQRQPK